MNWLGQHIWGFISRFRNDVYLEKLDTSSETDILVVDSEGKITTNASAGGGGTGTVSVLAVVTFNFNPSNTTQYCAPGNSGIASASWSQRRADFDDGTDKIVYWLQNGIIIPHACTLEGIKGAIRVKEGAAEGESHTFKFLHIPAGDILYNVTSGNNSGLHRFCQASTTVTADGGYVPISANGTSSDNSNLTQPLVAGDMLIPMIKENGGRINGSIFGSISIYIS